jgi:tRNA nucleotidyltransferase (CCA-adding enzyme)
MAADALRRPERLDDLIEACRADACSRPGRGDDYPPAERIRGALAVVKGVDAGAVAAEALLRFAARSSDEPQPARKESRIAEAIRSARVGALREWKKALAA